MIQELLSHGGSLQEVLTTLDMGDGLTPLGFAVAHDRRAIGLQLVQACRSACAADIALSPGAANGDTHTQLPT